MALPLMSLFVPPFQAAAIILPTALAQDALTIWTYRRHWSAWNLAIMLPSSNAAPPNSMVIFIPIGNSIVLPCSSLRLYSVGTAAKPQPGGLAARRLETCVQFIFPQVADNRLATLAAAATMH